MTRPAILIAWEPSSPEEALAIQERLGPIADVEWEHSLGPDLRRDFLPRIEALVLARWPEWLEREAPRMRRLRYVACVPAEMDFVRMRAFEDLPQSLIIEAGTGSIGPGNPNRPKGSATHVEPVKEAAERVVTFLRLHGVARPPEESGVTGEAS